MTNHGLLIRPMICIGGPMHGKLCKMPLDARTVNMAPIPRPDGDFNISELVGREMSTSFYEEWRKSCPEYCSDTFQFQTDSVVVSGTFWRWSELTPEQGRLMAVQNMMAEFFAALGKC